MKSLVIKPNATTRPSAQGHKRGKEAALYINGVPCKIRHLPLKRTFDICFSLTALIVGAPVFLTIALLVRLSSKGPIFYSHQRVGRGGRMFPCYKFRTMHPDGAERLGEILKTNPTLREEWERTQKLKNDPRITPIGLLLRKLSLDELPQFWNVLRGDLSVVGPRPVVQEELEKHFGSKASGILSIRPGLTGIWQTSGRNNTTYEERIALDEQYVARRSLWLDLWLIAKTIPAMLFSRGAY